MVGKSNAQTTTVGLNLSIFNLNATVAIDLNSDASADINIQRYSGIDHTECAGFAVDPTTKLSATQISGTVYSNFSAVSMIYQATLACSWNSIWFPNTGLKYLGTYQINSPGDTTFGYLTLEFIDPSGGTCEDTLKIYSYTYANQSNVHVLAAEVISSLNESLGESGIAFFPNPVNNLICLDQFQIQSASTIILIDNSGKICFKKTLIPGESCFSVQGTDDGIYELVLVREHLKSIRSKLVILQGF